MDWFKLESEADLEKVVSDSFLDENSGVAIFKHSTRCSISTMAKTRLSFKWKFKEELPIYYLDLIQYRSISNLIAEKFSVAHESPQFLLIKNGECVYNSSHIGISVKTIESFLETKV
jgi:monothiol bacilliredoxin